MPIPRSQLLWHILTTCLDLQSVVFPPNFRLQSVGLFWIWNLDCSNQQNDATFTCQMLSAKRSCCKAWKNLGNQCWWLTYQTFHTKAFDLFLLLGLNWWYFHIFTHFSIDFLPFCFLCHFLAWFSVCLSQCSFDMLYASICAMWCSYQRSERRTRLSPPIRYINSVPCGVFLQK